MTRVAFELFGFPVYWYGLMFALGFLAGTTHWSWLGKRTGKPADLGSDITVVIMVGTLVGARAAYILSDLDYFVANPGKILAFREGGMVFYGGLVLSLGLLLGFARRRKLRMLDVLDFTATAVPLGHAFGRVGCFLNGCCQGREASWGLVDAAGKMRIPVQLFEAGGNLLIYAALTTFYLRRPAAGRVMALYFILYPAQRFLLEFGRGDDRLQVFAGLNAAQTTSLLLMAAAGVVWYFTGRAKPAPAGG